MADEKASLKRLTAYQTLRRNFTKLLDITPEDVCDFLFSDGVITLEELENSTNKLLNGKDRTRKLMMALQKAAQNDHKYFERFCDYLEQSCVSPGLSELGKKLKGWKQNIGLRRTFYH